MSEALVTSMADGGLVHVVVSGDIDLSNAAQVEDHLFGAISNQATAASVDLAGVGYLDSAGLRILFALAGRLEALQIALTLVVPVAAPARSVIELSGLSSVVSVRPRPGPRSG
jgi:anti-anti-sigma factor